MSGLVEQLQIEALDKNVMLSTLLRRAKLAAVKLGLSDAIGWVDAELNGYSDEPPAYRQVYGQPVYWNPYHGWQHLAFEESSIANALASRWVVEPVTSLEETLSSDSQTMMLNYNNDVLIALNKMADLPITRAALSIGRGSLTAILEHVRNQVFEWALTLETAGITGDGISFSSEEKKIASNVPIHIGTFHGSFNTGELSGANSRLNFQNIDESTNINENSNLFVEIERALATSIDVKNKQKLVQNLHQLRDAKSKAERLSAYQSFVAASADHMTILAPFLPALASYIASI